MISRLARSRGKVLLLLGGHRFHGHSLRETGFRSYMREYAPEFEVMDALITLETRRLTYELVMDTIAKHRDLATSTIENHLAQAIESGAEIDPRRCYSSEEESEMRAAFEGYDEDALKPVFEHLEGRISYGKLRLFRAIESQPMR